MKEKLESDRCAIDKFNEKVDEWKVSLSLINYSLVFIISCLQTDKLQNCFEYLIL